MGWKMGFEPTTLGTTILYSNQLSYIHRVDLFPNRCANIHTFFYSPKFSEIYFEKLRATIVIPIDYQPAMRHYKKNERGRHNVTSPTIIA